VAVGIIAAALSSAAFAQDVTGNSSGSAQFVRIVKMSLKENLEKHPRDRVLIRFRDGSRAFGHVGEIRDDDFVLKPAKNLPPRSIAYAELAAAPERIQPKYEKILLWAGLSPLVVICLPLMLLVAALGIPD
jgi:hypothetical protein